MIMITIIVNTLHLQSKSESKSYYDAEWKLIQFDVMNLLSFNMDVHSAREDEHFKTFKSFLFVLY